MYRDAKEARITNKGEGSHPASMLTRNLDVSRWSHPQNQTGGQKRSDFNVHYQR